MRKIPEWEIHYFMEADGKWKSIGGTSLVNPVIWKSIRVSANEAGEMSMMLQSMLLMKKIVIEPKFITRLGERDNRVQKRVLLSKTYLRKTPLKWTEMIPQRI